MKKLLIHGRINVPKVPGSNLGLQGRDNFF